VDSHQPHDVMLLARVSAGSSTACLLVLAGNRMFASNLGDSGFLILRNGQIIFHTPQQQHKFNFPYQVHRSVCSHSSPVATCTMVQVPALASNLI
jgi:protein phosphatase PTC7